MKQRLVLGAAVRKLQILFLILPVIILLADSSASWAKVKLGNVKVWFA